MLNKQVKIGEVYTCKVSNRVVLVRVEKVSWFGGWEIVNLRTGRPNRIKTGGRLRRHVPAESIDRMMEIYH